MKVFQKMRSNAELPLTIASSPKNLLMFKMKVISPLNLQSKAFKRRLVSQLNPKRMRHKEGVEVLKAEVEQEAEAEANVVLETEVQVREEEGAITQKRRNLRQKIIEILSLESLIQNMETVITKIIKVNALNKIDHQDKTKPPLTLIDTSKTIIAVNLTIDLLKTIGVKDNNPTRADGLKTITMFINLEIVEEEEEISQDRIIIIVNTKIKGLTKAKGMLLEQPKEAALLKLSIMMSTRKVTTLLEQDILTELSQLKNNIMIHNTIDREDLNMTMKSKTLLLLIFNSD